MKLLSRADIVGAKDLPSERVEVPEWGGFVFVRGMTARERDRYEMALFSSGKPETDASVRAPILVACVVDEAGKNVFCADDIPDLEGKSLKAVERIVDVAKRLSGMGKEAKEEAEKKSVSPGEGSSTASPSA